MPHVSAEAVAWTITLLVVLAIVGLAAMTTWRWRQRPSAAGAVGRDMREDSRSKMPGQILASNIDKRATLQEPDLRRSVLTQVIPAARFL